MIDSARARQLLSALGTSLLACIATIGVVQLSRNAFPGEPSAFARLTASPARLPTIGASAASDAFGVSGNVKLRFSLPGGSVEFPMDLVGTTDSLRYQWVTIADSSTRVPPRLLGTGALIAPMTPGFYHMAVLHGDERQILPEPTLAVMVPFDEKVAGTLNGYRIGTYIAEKFGKHDHERPAGFLEVRPENLNLQVTKHLRLADFVTHDDQADVWPKYVVLNPRLLDKLELVFADLGGTARPNLNVDIHSGFRSPSHNANVRRAASDSRHQYGDAADVAIDVDGDGKITILDELLVMLAVDRVEEKHPDLAGGLGMYVSRRYPSPYLHIDARGKRARWTG
ncbi:MAG: D-Ala-D-Ala carboxypeptidase family metallohydrolase [Gemmatimonadota bacterium]|nr:D-Ala-D-Ala carboxypeptidase family metallohydrolase [Gemmatimonadota bacterium]